MQYLLNSGEKEVKKLVFMMSLANPAVIGSQKGELSKKLVGGETWQYKR